MDYKHYYKILGVAANTDAAEIKASYRKLARKYHPDVSSEADADAKFKQIGEAYAVLKDPAKRAEYDQLRAFAARRADSHFRSPAGWAQRSFRMRGHDVHHKLTLFLEEAQRGGQQQITLRIPAADEYGFVVLREKMFNVKIPAGVVPGQRMRLAGQGAPGSGGGDPGDLVLQIEIAPHPHFGIDGKNILLTLPVTEWEIALGTQVEVPTLSGKLKLKIPPGSSDGDKFCIKGRGLAGAPPGDQLVILNVVATMHAIINSWRHAAL